MPTYDRNKVIPSGTETNAVLIVSPPQQTEGGFYCTVGSFTSSICPTQRQCIIAANEMAEQIYGLDVVVLRDPDTSMPIKPDRWQALA
jgi:hypothetical protein